MGTRAGLGRAGGLALVMLGSVAAGGFVAGSAGATVSPEPQGHRAAGTWGACGSWWSETPTRSESGSVCGVDGLVTENGQTTQLAEPLISVSRYVCVRRPPGKARARESVECSSDSFTGTVRRSEMTVDPLLRRATIRGTLGGCTLDLEFAGLGSPHPQGGLWESHGLSGARPAVSAGGNQTFTSQASWWGGVCGRTVAPAAGGAERGEGSIFRSAEASLNGFGGEGGDGHGHGEG